MLRIVVVMAGLMLLSQGSRAEDFKGVEVVAVARGNVSFKHEGKTVRKPVGLSMKVIDDKGNTHDPILGAAQYLLPGNIVDIKTAQDKTARREVIVEIKFVSGKVGELPKELKGAGGGAVNLRPDPEFKGMVFGGDGVVSDPYWINYIRRAKVGDFLEYTRGTDKEPGRMETVEVGKDYVITAKVSYILGSRNEMRMKHRAPPAGAAKPQSPPPKKSSARPKSHETEVLEIGGKKVKCEIETRTLKKWRSADIPFDGIVKEESRVPYVVTDCVWGK